MQQIDNFLQNKFIEAYYVTFRICERNSRIEKLYGTLGNVELYDKCERKSIVP